MGLPRRTRLRGFGRHPTWLLIPLVAAVYLPSLGNDFVYDDKGMIVAEPRPRGLADIVRVFGEPHVSGLPYYRPVMRASYLTQKALHGDVPEAFRAVNIAVMGAVALLAAALLRSRGFGVRRTPAALAAALFVLHPVASSCVYPILGRDTALAGALVLAATVAWLRGHRAAATAAFAVAIFAKEQSVMVPLLFAWADFCRVGSDPPEAGFSARSWIRRHAGSVAVLLFYLGVRVALAGDTESRLALAGHPLLPVLSYLYLLQVSIVPFAQLVYEPGPLIWFSPWRLGVVALVLVALAWACRRVGAPSRRAVGFWLGWVIATQLPTANWLVQETPFAERYAFLGTLGLPAIAAGLMSGRWHDAGIRRLAVIVSVFAILVAAGVSLQRARYFRDDQTFARQWLRFDPDSPDAHHALGMTLAQEGRFEEALEHYDAAQRGSPDSGNIATTRGAVLLVLGRREEARAAFLAALEAEPAHPGAHFNLGLLYARNGQSEPAAFHYRAALRSSPHHFGAHHGLGQVMLGQKNLVGAEVEFREARRLRPDSAEVVRNLGLVHLGRGDLPKARALFLEALRLDPDDLPSRRQLKAIKSKGIEGAARAR